MDNAGTELGSGSTGPLLFCVLFFFFCARGEGLLMTTIFLKPLITGGLFFFS